MDTRASPDTHWLWLSAHTPTHTGVCDGRQVKEREAAMQKVADQHMDQLTREVTAVKQDFRVRVNEFENAMRALQAQLKEAEAGKGASAEEVTPDLRVGRCRGRKRNKKGFDGARLSRRGQSADAEATL